MAQRMKAIESARIAVLVFWMNKEPTIAKVVKGIQKALPTAKIYLYIYDKNSIDGTAEVAEEAGAGVILGQRYGRLSKHRALSAD